MPLSSGGTTSSGTSPTVNNATITNTLTVNTLTGNRVLIADSDKEIKSSAVTSTELGYLSGVTSPIQTQLGGKLSNIVEDLTPQLGGDIDTQTYKIFTSASNQKILIEPSGTGYIHIAGTGTANVVVGANTDQSLIAGAANELRLQTINASNQSKYIGLRAPTNLTVSQLYTFPLIADNGKYLKTDASGNLVWDTPAGTGINNLYQASDANISSPLSGQFLIYDGVDTWDNKTLSGDVSSVSIAGAVTLVKGNLTETNSAVLIISGGSNAVLGAGATIEVQQSTTSTSGYLSSTDWNTFNNKVSATRNIGTTSPLTGGGNLSADRTIAIDQATTSTDGYLSSTDWNTFNNKVSATRAINTTAPLTGGGNLSADRTLSIPQATGSQDGYLSSTDWTTFNNKSNYVDPLTTNGDIVIRSAGTTTRLPIGTNTQVLTVVAGLPAWANPTGGGGNAGSIGSSSLIGEDFAYEPASGYSLAVFDEYDVDASNVDSYVRDAETNATYDNTNKLYQLSCDKSLTCTTTGTSYTLSGAPSFTVAAGDIIYDNASGQFRRIASITDQQNGTLDVAFTVDLSADPVMVSQAVWSKDLINFVGSASENNRPKDFFAATDILQINIDYFDSIAAMDKVPNFTSAAACVVSASNSGLASDTSSFPNSNAFSNIYTRPIAPAQVTDYPLLNNTDMERLFLVFFPNPANGSVTTTANILNYRVSFYEENTVLVGGALDSAYAMSDGSASEINCSAPTVVSGKTRLQLSWTFIPNLNPGTTTGDLEVVVDGQSLPRYVAGATVDAWYREIAGTQDTIEFWTDLTSSPVSIEVRRRQGSYDTSDNNALEIAEINNPTRNQDTIITVVGGKSKILTAPNILNGTTITVESNGYLAIYGQLDINTGGSLIINSGGQVDVFGGPVINNGTLTNNGTLRLLF